MGLNEELVCLIVSQKKLKDEYKDPDIDLIWQGHEKYLRSCHGVVQVPLAYIIRKTMTVQTYGDYPSYATPDDEMIARMLHLPSDKNKVHNETDA